MEKRVKERAAKMEKTVKEKAEWKKNQKVVLEDSKKRRWRSSEKPAFADEGDDDADIDGNTDNEYE
eukprot:13670454-Heterocapsa_arctica.AAC.1